MEQARSFAWGLQPAISNYQSFLSSERKEEIAYVTDLARVRNQGLQYLLYGKFLRTPDFENPAKEFDISRLSIYAGKMGESVTSFTGTFPLIYSGTWQAENKQIGIALASISSDPLRLSFSFNPDNYELAQNGEVYIIDSEGKRYISSYSGGKISVNLTLKARGICIIEFTGREEAIN